MISNGNLPLISIVVPIYNMEKYLEECVATLLQQSYTNLEIILVDDGSMDRTPLICESLLKLDGRIVVISQKNKGVAAARNTGLKAANGEFVAFVDPDDLVHTQYIEVLYGLLIKTGLNYSICSFISFKDSPPKYDLSDLGSYQVISGETLLNSFFTQDPYFQVVVWKKLYRTDFLHQQKLQFPEGYWYEDNVFTSELLYLGYPAAYSKARLYGHRQGYGSSFSSVNVVQREEGLIELEKKLVSLSQRYQNQFLNENHVILSTLNIQLIQQILKSNLEEGQENAFLTRTRKRISKFWLIFLRSNRLNAKNKIGFFILVYGNTRVLRLIIKMHDDFLLFKTKLSGHSY